LVVFKSESNAMVQYTEVRHMFDREYRRELVSFRMATHFVSEWKYQGTGKSVHVLCPRLIDVIEIAR